MASLEGGAAPLILTSGPGVRRISEASCARPLGNRTWRGLASCTKMVPMTRQRRSGLLALMVLAGLGCGSVTAQSDAGPASGTAGSTGGAGQIRRWRATQVPVPLVAAAPAQREAPAAEAAVREAVTRGPVVPPRVRAVVTLEQAAVPRERAVVPVAPVGLARAPRLGPSIAPARSTATASRLRTPRTAADRLSGSRTGSSEKVHYTALESACDRTYPACGCAAGPPVTDDGSVALFGGMAGVSCQAGMCKTFSKACGQPCGAGRSCVTCMMPDAGATSACSLQCMKDTDCTEPGRTKCQFTSSTGVCTDSTMACGLF